ncbi:protein kinase (macronuclear) [Tetrahymena thermophila SB210]|uniref:Protein kinase n=1 Tax=Tetrahymena thermophila (strain SB210) TaxID=312017 RepID=Q234M3_TETTS|nr:protein kinase [Tetrahymena thermophila SB210]EAR91980.1 protein kinase [Tetrahymena thermophila SB210]|eukprot:XP_001012225.1 protein kinase [Tetrahymena thermophila SB210]
MFDSKQNITNYLEKNGFNKIQFQANQQDQYSKDTKNLIQAWNSQKKQQAFIKVIEVRNPQQTIDRIKMVQNFETKFIQKYDKPPEIIDNGLIVYSNSFQKNGNLKNYQQKKQLNIDIVQRLACKILIGLDCLHKNKLFHGRFKIENVLMDQNESILLTDYCIQDSDDFFLEKEQNHFNQEKNIFENLNVSIEEMQSQDLYRAGVLIISLCDLLREKEQNLDQQLRYNTKRSYYLQQIANNLVDQDNLRLFNLQFTLEKLDYFEGIYQSFLFGLNTYEGEMQNNKKHGKGVFKYFIGDLVFGVWENDKYTGNGVTYYQNGDISDKRDNNYIMYWKKSQCMIEGVYSNDQKAIQGTYFIDGSQWKVTYINKKFQGYSEIYYKNNENLFKGNLKDSQQHGYGELFWKVNQVFKGKFQNNQIDGLGQFKLQEGSEYFGQMKYNKFHGYGKLYWNIGSYYEGQWVNHQRQGYGKYYDYFSGSIYEGMFQTSQQDGEGILKQQNGTIKYGLWQKGIYVQGSDKQVDLEQLKQKFLNLSLSLQKSMR